MICLFFLNIKKAKVTNTETIFVKNVLIYKSISNLLSQLIFKELLRETKVLPLIQGKEPGHRGNQVSNPTSKAEAGFSGYIA